MAGSILRLTIFVVFSSSINSSLLQRPISFIQNPFDLMGILRKEIQVRGAQMFTYSPTSSAINFSPPIRPIYRRMPRNFHTRPLTSSSYSSVIRKKPELSFLTSKISNNFPSKVLMKNVSVPMDTFKRKNFSYTVKPSKQNGSSALGSLTNLTTGEYTNRRNHNSRYYDDSYSKHQNTILDDNYHVPKNAYSSSTTKMQYQKPYDISDPSKTTHRIQQKFIIKQNKISHSHNKGYRANHSTSADKLPTLPFVYKNHNQIHYNDPKFYKTHRGDDEEEKPKTSFLGYIISTLTQLPVIGNVLRASVDPLFRPIVGSLKTGKIYIGILFTS